MAISTKVDNERRARITSQGQITIPKAVRDELGVRAGDDVVFQRAGEDMLVIPKRRRNVLEFAGIAAGRADRIPNTADELDALIAVGMTAAAVEKARRAKRA
jgi:antitoxin PrlF